MAARKVIISHTLIILKTERSPYSRLGERVGSFLLPHVVASDFSCQGKYKIDIDFYHRKVKPKFIAAFQNEYGAKKFNDMYAGQLEMKLLYLWNTGLLRCGKNPDFDIDKDGWVWPNAVKGKGCSKVFYLRRPSLSFKNQENFRILEGLYSRLGRHHRSWMSEGLQLSPT
jgi:hypothetical protein